MKRPNYFTRTKTLGKHSTNNSNANTYIENRTFFKEVNDLNKEYDKCLEIIKDQTDEDLSKILNNNDIKYFLINNDLDYNLFCCIIKYNRPECIQQMIDCGFEFNTNTFLIELYKSFLNKKTENFDDEEHKVIFFEEEFKFLIDYKNGFLLKENCLTEFYFLLMTDELYLAPYLLNKSYSNKIREFLNKLFIDDDTSILKSILFNTDMIYTCVHNSLERGLDGVAL